MDQLADIMRSWAATDVDGEGEWLLRENGQLVIMRAQGKQTHRAAVSAFADALGFARYLESASDYCIVDHVAIGAAASPAPTPSDGVWHGTVRALMAPRGETDGHDIVEV